jgi:predicted phage-related endonuclease
MSKKDIMAQIAELKELQSLIEEAQAAAEEIRDTLKAEMQAQGVEILSVGGYKVRWQTISGSRFDTTTFKKENAELYSRYTIETATRRFSVA